ncbi:hypothetical protein [Robbsia andropogonis]|uniref:hypothetical protein n=1 Tax=Robbsia andropogonis TaxID=28092 RepID=UPI0012F8C10B|nr:hypothetical protein [Robbsia andropogonis]
MSNRQKISDMLIKDSKNHMIFHQRRNFAPLPAPALAIYDHLLISRFGVIESLQQSIMHVRYLSSCSRRRDCDNPKRSAIQYHFYRESDRICRSPDQPMAKPRVLLRIRLEVQDPLWLGTGDKSGRARRNKRALIVAGESF